MIEHPVALTSAGGECSHYRSRLSRGVAGGVPGLRGQAVSGTSVTARVRDEQGATVAGAEVKMSGVDTGLVFNATTNDSGLFSFPNVPIGSYTLQANASGLQTYVQSGLELRVNEHVQVNIRQRWVYIGEGGGDSQRGWFRLRKAAFHG